MSVMLTLTEEKKEAIESPRRMKMQNRRYGATNGCLYPVIRISGKYLESFGFQVGDEIEVTFELGQITIRKVISTPTQENNDFQPNPIKKGGVL